LSALWAAIAPALGNHIWQSTLFAIIAGLLTLILRKNHARARYWLWMAASMKFLIPFSLLVAIGSHLAWSRGSAGAKAGLYFAMEEVSQPFTQPAMSVISRSTPSIVSPGLIHLLPTLLAGGWLCGFVVVLSVWCVRWREISAAIRGAVPLREGREVEALRRLERIAGVRKRVEMLLSRSSLEPGIFGMARPVLVWPEGISERLEVAHLEAILAHELWHVRRRDNLAAAIHMAVEAIFWFHPLVWWLGARLVDERERACDEEVLGLGSERQIYAESILKVCEFCVESPLACVSGVTGADLKKRMVHIMSEHVVSKLDFSKKLLLSAAGLAALAVPIVFGLANATPSRAQSQAETTVGIRPGYQVVSIKPVKSVGGIISVRMLSTPDGFTATGVTLQGVIQEAYGVEDNQLSGAPNWVNSEKYDIEAKVDESAVDELQKLSPDQRNLEQQRMLQVLLADRFKLTLHRETKVLPVYALVIAENGPKLQESKPGETYPNGFTGPDRGGAGMMKITMDGKMGQLAGQGVSVTSLEQALSQRLGRNVLDKTGLRGNYDFTLQWPTTEGLVPGVKGTEDGQQRTDSSPSPGPTIFTAIQEQLGLKLEFQKVPTEILVIDHAEMPSEN
jgi:bla regulator protein blaR1